MSLNVNADIQKAISDSKKKNGNFIEFTDKELDKILELQQQKGFETAQEAVMSAVDLCIK